MSIELKLMKLYVVEKDVFLVDLGKRMLFGYFGGAD